ncbi:hypothetical protein E3N88_20479 [Mikania micrantha]|uniref:Uncharacterized protein n=1 Tax=Mikania micrantha TaxID=192012 RepID=A0A5N6NH32_9ASTR|nr:hypothetical protein E3N88_20479 [Mikania micrantha]
MASGSNNTTKTTVASASLDPGRKYGTSDSSNRDVSEALGAHEPFYETRSSMAGTGRGDDEAGPSRKDKGKCVLYDEDEIEEDIGLTDVEEDDRVPGYDD